MGADPACSVVNEWGRSHDVKNLFIVDGGLFVTSGGEWIDVERQRLDGRGRRSDEAAPNLFD
jgi:GMC oxidoreductase